MITVLLIHSIIVLLFFEQSFSLLLQKPTYFLQSRSLEKDSVSSSEKYATHLEDDILFLSSEKMWWHLNNSISTSASNNDISNTHHNSSSNRVERLTNTYEILKKRPSWKTPCGLSSTAWKSIMNKSPSAPNVRADSALANHRKGSEKNKVNNSNEIIQVVKDNGSIPIGKGSIRQMNYEFNLRDTNCPISLEDYLIDNSCLKGIHKKKVDELAAVVRRRGTIRTFSAESANKIRDALAIAYIVLWGKSTSRSQEIMINRATGIAALLGEFHADFDVIVAGILHEVVLSLTNSKNYDAISGLVSRFGKDIVSLCDKYSRLPKFLASKSNYTLPQSENQIQMLVSCTEDYRVLFIRLADRVHTMRTLKKLPLDDEDQKKIAQEGLYVYAPLAHKMGAMKVKGELEDLAFKVLEPHMFQLTRLQNVWVVSWTYPGHRVQTCSTCNSE